MGEASACGSVACPAAAEALSGGGGGRGQPRQPRQQLCLPQPLSSEAAGPLPRACLGVGQQRQPNLGDCTLWHVAGAASQKVVHAARCAHVSFFGRVTRWAAMGIAGVCTAACASASLLCAQTQCRAASSRHVLWRVFKKQPLHLCTCRGGCAAAGSGLPSSG